jgi:hypothetical protein
VTGRRDFSQARRCEAIGLEGGVLEPVLLLRLLGELLPVPLLVLRGERCVEALGDLGGGLRLLLSLRSASRFFSSACVSSARRRPAEAV